MRISDWSSDVCSSDLSASTFAWTLGEGDGKPRDFRIEPVMVSNDPGTLRTVLLDGEGIMLTSDVMVRAYVERGLVQRALAGWCGPDVELHALFPRGEVQAPDRKSTRLDSSH